MRTSCLAMILAGGQGSRLKSLTKNVAKPAVPFGGKYRIIDFPLSNCAHSGIQRVGVLTQYRPFELHNYVRNGDAWDLDQQNGGVFILPPYAREEGGDWYKGTADAIFQNLNFIALSNPEFVLILSGDHIYSMDYSKMIDEHIANQAEATIAVIRVSMEEASRFGIMNTDENQRIQTFEEKPKHPKSNLASMGIYLFSTDFLKRYLEEDARDENSEHDFGKNVIPKMLADHARLFAYPFDGYWKDVGTIESLWQANMDFLAETPPIELGGTRRIRSANLAMPPHYLGMNARVIDSMVSEGATVLGYVNHSIISTGVKIDEEAQVTNSVIMPFAQIGAGAVVDHAIIGSHAQVMPGANVLGKDGAIVFCGDGDTVRGNDLNQAG